MSINKKAQRIDLDTEDNIYHLKVTFLGAKWWLGCQPSRDTKAHGREDLSLRLRTIQWPMANCLSWLSCK